MSTASVSLHYIFSEPDDIPLMAPLRQSRLRGFSTCLRSHEGPKVSIYVINAYLYISSLLNHTAALSSLRFLKVTHDPIRGLNASKKSMGDDAAW